MAIKNWVRSFWMPDGQSPKWEKIVKSMRYSPENQSLIIFDVASGFGKYLKRVPAKFTKQQWIPASHVSLMPCGTREGIKTPDQIRFVCTARNKCHEALLKELSEIDKQNNLRGDALNSLKEKFDQIMEKVKTTQNVNAVLVAHQEMEKEFAKAGVK